VDTRSNLDQVRTTAGELNLKDLSEVVNVPERNKLITQAWRENAAGRQTIIFCVDIQHSVDMAAMFRAQGVRADAVWGDDPQRAEKLRQHDAGEIQILCNCGVLTEGYDSPIVSCIVLARPTKSTLLYEQMIGRGTRLFENKPNCLVIDCMDQSRRHRLASLPSLLGMPAEMNLRNRSAMATLKILEDAARQYPHIDLSGLRDIAKLEEYIENINLFEVKFDDVVVEHSQLNWFKTMDGGYVLSLAQGETASIKQNILGKFDISVTVNRQNYSGERETLEMAFKDADAAIEARAADVINMVRREQRWHKDAVTERQMSTLKKIYKGKAIPSNMTKGAASKLISQFFFIS
jgi:superfamily II DNA or RNA helicase